MNTEYNLIIAKNKIITSSVSRCSYNRSTKHWDVLFKNGKLFSYSYLNLTWLTNPTFIDPQNHRFYYHGAFLSGIKSIYFFKGNPNSYFHFQYQNGIEEDYPASELTTKTSCLSDDKSLEIVKYFKAVAEKIKIKDEDNSLLYDQYENMNFIDFDTAAAAYLYSKNSKHNDNATEPLIFPFGSNESQYKAVKDAIDNQISIIEGPPGTGKTQTILNIIANLLIRNKSVLVASNNNSAVKNIVDKLSEKDCNLGFLCALLGKNENYDTFIKSQSGEYPKVDKRKVDFEECSCEIFELEAKISKLYILQKKLAKLISLSKEIEKEYEHFSSVFNIDESDVLPLFKNTSAQGTLFAMQAIEFLKLDNKKVNFFRQFVFLIKYKLNLKKVMEFDEGTLLLKIQKVYYNKAKEELYNQIREIENSIQNTCIEDLQKELRKQSLDYLKGYIVSKISKQPRTVYSIFDITQNLKDFVRDYPVVLSTAYMAKKVAGDNFQFDYVITDESSQVDVVTGFLTLVCAKNAVVVGDSKQLPNIVTSKTKSLLDTIRYDIDEKYNYVQNSFLQSVETVFRDGVHCTLLNEHYRCSPLIINYCNKKYYKGSLSIMTEYKDDAMGIYTSVAGNHRRDRTNLRQAEIIVKEVLPKVLQKTVDIGIISPYRDQVELLRNMIPDERIEIDTIHKFQGREKEYIIFSTVDDTITEFSDDPNLINVAVSRAKEKFILIASEMPQPNGSNLGDLIGYIRYNNCEVIKSNINSVFDYLYSQNEKTRIAYLKNKNRISEYDSENLFFGLLTEELKQFESLGVVCHLPLYLLFNDYSILNQEEKSFVIGGLSHTDFLIYNIITKRPLCAMEVDGYHYHKSGTKQNNRDAIKNSIFKKYNIPIYRFSTNGSCEVERINEILKSL